MPKHYDNLPPEYYEEDEYYPEDEYYGEGAYYQEEEHYPEEEYMDEEETGKFFQDLNDKLTSLLHVSISTEKMIKIGILIVAISAIISAYSLLTMEANETYNAQVINNIVKIVNNHLIEKGIQCTEQEIRVGATTCGIS